jgi:ABC-2 type transport system ATP-binding protein
MKSIISIKNLSKTFGKFTAVNNISFTVNEGELFGLLGPNGAGKTTTINMLSTLLKPTSGKAMVAGFDVSRQKDAVRNNIGIVFQEPALDGRLTGRENLEFHAMMYGMKKEERTNKINEVLELVELSDKANVLVDNYSGGMKRRLEIGRGLIHNPNVLFLDEPTIGLDAQTRRHIWDYIKKLNKESKVTIILTTHYMEEADYLCNRVAIVDKGRIVAMNTPEKLKDVLGGDILTLEVAGNAERLLKEVSKMKCVKKIKLVENSMIITVVKGEKRIPEIIARARKIKVSIASVNLHKPSLEDVFLHFTGKNIREMESHNGFSGMKMGMRGH